MKEIKDIVCDSCNGYGYTKTRTGYNYFETEGIVCDSCDVICTICTGTGFIEIDTLTKKYSKEEIGKITEEMMKAVRETNICIKKLADAFHSLLTEMRTFSDRIGKEK